MALVNTTALQQAGKAERGDRRALGNLLRDIIATIQSLSDTEIGFIDGVTAGTVTASKALVVDANKDIGSLRHLTMTGNIRSSIGTVAAAGSSKTDAAALTADQNIVTGADGTKGVALPAAVVGLEITVLNSTSGNLKVYPKDSDDAVINALATDAAFTQGIGKSATYRCTAAAQWYVANSAAPDSTLRTLVAGGSTLSITEALHDNKTIALDTVTGTVCTLPAATGSGAKFKFLVTVLATSNSHIVKVANSSDTMIGTIAGVSDDPATVKGWIAGSTADTITLNRGTTGSVSKGEWVELVDVATNVWSVTGMISQTGTEATPFSATV